LPVPYNLGEDCFDPTSEIVAHEFKEFLVFEEMEN
jgi:hypothetical protein